MQGGNKRSYELKQIFTFQLHVCLSAYDFLLPTKHLIWLSILFGSLLRVFSIFSFRNDKPTDVVIPAKPYIGKTILANLCYSDISNLFFEQS